MAEQARRAKWPTPAPNSYVPICYLVYGNEAELVTQPKMYIFTSSCLTVTLISDFNMFQYLLLILCLRAIAASPLSGRVISGQEATPHSWPWQISLQFAYDIDPDFFQHICGGSLISANWVMTAAHCIISTPGRFAVVLGEHDLEQKGNEYLRHVQFIITHPGWNPASLANGNDIALVRLAKPAYGTPDVQLANLPANNQILPNGYTCYITGWGLTQHLPVGSRDSTTQWHKSKRKLWPNGYPSTTLQQALLPVVDYATCSSPYWWSTAVNENMICAGGDGVTSGCQGDSGGPLNCQAADGIWVVQGIVSFGPVYCVIEKKPTVFTRVSAYTDWIFQTMEQNGGM
ncbi:chymotrypsin-like elastase family member 2A [Heterodontus francisci]|uniref:chymotrypsin-like elastase family member 2A n=1 Tax=Heterodontus francisci TaxID=7792 RepID=UPI00355B4C88